jgi:hypothetical protein
VESKVQVWKLWRRTPKWTYLWLVNKSSFSLKIRSWFNGIIARMLKHLSSMHVIREEAADVYTSTPLSDALVEPRFKDGIIYT